VVYYFDAEGNKKYHGETCSRSREGEVVGTVSEKDGKKIVVVTKVKFNPEPPGKNPEPSKPN
jgi:hypothetical protein